MLIKVSMKEAGRMVSFMGMASLFGLTVHHMREIMPMARRKVLEFSHIHQKNHIKEIGKKGYKMVKVVFTTKREILSKMGCG